MPTVFCFWTLIRLAAFKLRMSEDVDIVPARCQEVCKGLCEENCPWCELPAYGFMTGQLVSTLAPAQSDKFY